MAKLQGKGLGMQKKQASAISEEDERKMWDSGALNSNDAHGLSKLVYYYNCIYNGMRGADEHQNLTVEQFVFGEENGVEKVTFHGRLEKANQGGLKHRKRKPKKVDTFAQPENQHCPVKVLRFYLSKIGRSESGPSPL